MKFMCTLAIVLFTALLPASKGYSNPVVDGVFGFSYAEETIFLAVWVPLESSDSITGIRWYNNDGSVVFPELLAIAGHVDQPGILADATIVATSFSGVSTGWSELFFAQPIATATSGLYVIMRLPTGSEYGGEGLGGGPGIGYTIGDGLRRCWISGNGELWNPISSDFQMAVEIIPTENKNGNVLILGLPGYSQNDISKGGLYKATLSVSPNPFNPQTEIRYTMPRAGIVDLKVYTIRGQLVCILAQGNVEAGLHVVTWNGRNYRGQGQASGVYFVRLTSDTHQLSSRITLIR